MFNHRVIAAAALAGLLPGAASAALLIDDADFTGACGGAALTCVGNTATVGSVLRLTPAQYYQAGAAYSTTPITLGASDTFSTTFNFRFTGAGGIDPADGIVFVLAENTTGLGGAGFGIGYSGLAGNSVAIRFDTYYDAPASFGGNDPNSNHVGLDTNGSLTDLVQATPYGNGSCGFTNGSPPQNDHTAFGCMSNGDVWTAAIGYNGGTHELTASLQDGNAAPQLLIDTTLDVAATLGSSSAFVGFTSGTGSGYENHDLTTWKLDDTTALAPPAPAVPEPLSWTLLAAGVAGLAACARRGRHAARTALPA